MNLPGAVLGVRHRPGSLPVEYMAARVSPLILITTPERIFAISPEDEGAFLNAFRRQLSRARSHRSGALCLFRLAAEPILNEPLPRNLILVGLALSLLLMMWWSGDPWEGTGAPEVVAWRECSGYCTPVRLLLLPVLNLFFYIIDAILGCSSTGALKAGRRRT